MKIYHDQSPPSGLVNLNIFYFNLVRYTYKYIQVTECKRIRTKAGSLCYSSLAIIRCKYNGVVCLSC